MQSDNLVEILIAYSHSMCTLTNSVCNIKFYFQMISIPSSIDINNNKVTKYSNVFFFLFSSLVDELTVPDTKIYV